MHIVVVAYSLSRGENASSSSQQLSSPPKATFFDGRKKRASLHLSLSLSLCFEGKNRARKRYRKGRIFSLFSSPPKKDKKNRGEHPKKRKKNSSNTVCTDQNFLWWWWWCAQTKTLPPLDKQRERRVDFKLAQKQPNVFYCYDASGSARVWKECGSDRARFPDERERERANFSLQKFFSFSFCSSLLSQFRLEKLSLFQAVIK